MCLAIPVKVVEIKDNRGFVELSGLKKEVALDLTPDVREGDYVLLHAGFAIKKIDEKEAKETLELLEEINGVSG